MAKYLALKAGITAIASLAASSSADGRTIDPPTDFCTTVTMDPDLGRALGFVDTVSDNLSKGFTTILRDALLSVGQVNRSSLMFYYEPEKAPACSSGGKAVWVNIRYSGRGRSDPITVRTEVRVPGRRVFKSSHVFTIVKEISSGRVKPFSIQNADELVINTNLKSEATSIARWILKGGSNAL